jgi:hypothetical protein
MALHEGIKQATKRRQRGEIRDKENKKQKKKEWFRVSII